MPIKCQWAKLASWRFSALAPTPKRAMPFVEITRFLSVATARLGSAMAIKPLPI